MAELEGSLDDITVLIPAAGRVPEGVLSLSNISCTALIPVAGRPVIYWTLTYLRKLGLSKFILAVPERGQFVEDFVDCTIGRDAQVEFIVPPEGKLGDTVGALVNHAKTKSALVVLGDTYFQFADPGVVRGGNEPFVLTAPVLESYRWNIAERTPDGYVAAFRDKVRDLPPPLAAVVGVYFFPDVQLLKSAIAEVSGGKPRIDFTRVLESVSKKAPLRAIQAGEWRDVGHPDRQAGSNAALLQNRAFNQLQVDPVLSTITKRSSLKEKFIDEINYLRLLPRELSVLFPRMIDFSTDWSDPYVTMEYYGYSTLAEAFVYENIDPGIWENVFRHLYSILTGPFAKHRQPLPAEVVRDFYLKKTKQRVDALQGPADLLAMKRSLENYWPRIEQDVAKLAETAQTGVIHGDLCFSNILYDFRSAVCKFIDPRGSFGTSGILGDPRYDVAKLYHSVYGLYDFMTNDLFHVRSESDAKVSLDVRHRPLHRQILQRFDRVFFPHYDRREILLITGLIFAGIPALHYDKPQRQVAMFARALQIFSDLYEVV